MIFTEPHTLNNLPTACLCLILSLLAPLGVGSHKQITSLGRKWSGRVVVQFRTEMDAQACIDNWHQTFLPMKDARVVINATSKFLKSKNEIQETVKSL